MACNGNATEQCGGPNRLTLFNTTAPPGPLGPFVNPGVNGYHSLGCYKYVLFQFLSAVICLDWREHSRQFDLKWRASLYRLSRYGALDLDWSIGVDLTSDPRHASPNRSLTYLMLYREQAR